MGDESYPRERRIKQRADFLSAYREGLRADGRYATLYGLKRAAASGAGTEEAAHEIAADESAAILSWRLGITVTKRQAKAVRRNRLRRRIREWARRRQPPLPQGWDIVVVVRREAIDAEFVPLCEDLNRALGRLLAKAEPRAAPTHEA